MNITKMFYKVFYENGYLLGIGTGNRIPPNAIEITEAEYDDIMAVIHAKPTPPTGYEYYLKPDMTWELLELPPVPEEPTQNTPEQMAEALRILGVEV
jgi:hypothetical protein